MWNTINQWIFCQVLDCQSPPCTNVKSSNWRPSGDGCVGNKQRQTLCTCIWKRSNPTARPVVPRLDRPLGFDGAVSGVRRRSSEACNPFLLSVIMVKNRVPQKLGKHECVCKVLRTTELHQVRKSRWRPQYSTF